MRRTVAILIILAAMMLLTSCGAKDDAAQTNNVQTDSADAAAVNDADASFADDSPWVIVRSELNTYVYSDFVYDENGSIVKEIIHNTNEDNPREKLYEYIAQADGTTLMRKHETVDAFYAYEYLYDVSGKCIERRDYSSYEFNPATDYVEDNLDARVSYEYNEIGRLTKSTTVYENGSGEVISYTYDADGRLTSKVCSYLSSGDKWASYDIAYENGGNISKIVYWSESYGENTDEYECSIEKDYSEPVTYTILTDKEYGHEMQIAEYTYDDQGRMIKAQFDINSCIIPVEYFTDEGALMEESDSCIVTFMPLSLALEQQNAE